MWFSGLFRAYQLPGCWDSECGFAVSRSTRQGLEARGAKATGACGQGETQTRSRFGGTSMQDYCSSSGGSEVSGCAREVGAWR